MPVVISDSFSINESDYQIFFVRSSGPGGQNVNKTATKAQLRFNLSSAGVPSEMRERLQRIAWKRINDKGELVIEAQRYRTQEQNRLDAIERLVRMLRMAAQQPTPRHKTRPTGASHKRRLESKKRRAQTKRLRRRFPLDSPD